MTKVTFRPWEEVIVHESIEYTLNDLIQMCGIGVQPNMVAPPLRWAEGVVFRLGAMPANEAVAREMLEGKIHYSAVEWALMPKHQPVALIKEINVKIPIIDVSKTEILRDLAIALKGKKKQKKNQTKRTQ